METVSGHLLWNGQVKSLDDGPKQHVYWCWFGYSRVDAASEDLDQCHVGARRVGQDLWRGYDAIQFIEKNQSPEMLNGIGILPRPWSHGISRLRAEGDENVGDDQVEWVRMEGLYGLFDRGDDNYVCVQRFGHSALHHINMLRVIVDE